MQTHLPHPLPFIAQYRPTRSAPQLRGKPLPSMMFDAGDVRLTLESIPSMRFPGQQTLYGAVLFLNGKVDEGEGAVVQLLAEDEVVGKGSITPFGGFVFDGVAPGSYRLTVRLPAHFLVIEQVTIT